MGREDRPTLAEARQRGQGDAHLAADPTYARLIFRRISPYLSHAIVARTPLSADAVTALSIGSGIIGALLIVPGDVALNILAVLCLQAAYLFDVADGEVARIRGTASRRGTYLDLIGHFLQNRFLYGAAAWVLMTVTSFAPWSVVVSLGIMAFSSPFGLYARIHVLGGSAGEHPEHGSPSRGPDGAPTRGLLGATRRVYRRLAFIWNYPASMNLFCVALLVDAIAMGLRPDIGPLALPLVFAVFGSSLALKQVAHAFRLLGTSDWSR